MLYQYIQMQITIAVYVMIIVLKGSLCTYNSHRYIPVLLSISVHTPPTIHIHHGIIALTLLCPSNTTSHSPFVLFHIRSVSSHEPDTMRPSGSTATDLTYYNYYKNIAQTSYYIGFIINKV